MLPVQYRFVRLAPVSLIIGKDLIRFDMVQGASSYVKTWEPGSSLQQSESQKLADQCDANTWGQQVLLMAPWGKLHVRCDVFIQVPPEMEGKEICSNLKRSLQNYSDTISDYIRRRRMCSMNSKGQ